MSDNSSTISPHDAAEYWTQMGHNLVGIVENLKRMLPPTPTGIKGLSEDTRRDITEIFDQAVLAADTAAGVYGRMASAMQKQNGSITQFR